MILKRLVCRHIGRRRIGARQDFLRLLCQGASLVQHPVMDAEVAGLGGVADLIIVEVGLGLVL